MGIFKKGEKRIRRNRFGLSKPGWVVAAILLVGCLALFLDFPVIWDRGVDSVNDLAGFEMLPHFFNLPFKLGLDLQGGTHLVYQADLSNVESDRYDEAMQGVRDVIETRVNMFGVAEPMIQVSKVGDDYRLIVELAGIQDTAEAIKEIGETPYLEFREMIEQEELEKVIELQKSALEKISSDKEAELSEEGKEALVKEITVPTELTGRYLEAAQLVQNPQTYQLQISLKFDSEGARILEELTRRNLNRPLAVYLDGRSIVDTTGDGKIGADDFYAPVVQDVISGGEAVISGNFTSQEGKELVQRFNAGALPVPISLISQQTIGPSLGKISLDKSLLAGGLGFLTVLVFMILYYRLPGLISALALLMYLILLLALFKLVPVTLTLAGIAGVILSVGMAVDANVLIFERFREEFKSGRSLDGSIDEGFRRAWPAIRDGNISTVITCIILFVFATGLVKGFALTLGIGVLLSMFSAITITKRFLRLFIGRKIEGKKWMWR